MAKFKLKDTGRTHSGVGITAVRLLVLGVLLVLPVLALHRRGVDFRWVGLYVLVLNALTYWAYAVDKQQAEGGEWRVPEAQLHLLEILGGWPSAWLAQRQLRHKCSKGSYQFMFWLIVLVYQLVAFDSLQDWQLSRSALKWAQQNSAQRR